MPLLEKLRIENLTHPQVRMILKLSTSVWPHHYTKSSVDELADEMMEKWRALPDGVIFLLTEGDEAVAHARTFSRIIRGGGAEIRVMALAGVCVTEQRRGEGLGRIIVQASFGRIREKEFPLSLFQTNVPDFYRSLGARTVDNPFINSLVNYRDEKPWWNPYIMIYPASADWPDGIIDMNGPGY